MRLIHTADIHLDACFAGAGMPPGLGNRRRQSLRDVLVRILERAAEWPADAILIAGDLFEHGRVTRDTAAFLREVFQKTPVPIFIAPGNHDPYTTDSPYASETWPENVHIFRTPQWSCVALEEVPLTVHGFGFDGFEISSNPFGNLEVPDDGRVHVAVGHGSERGHQPAGKESYAPFDAAAAAAPGLAYLALGHFHGVTQIEGAFDTVMYYSGAPEGHGFNEPGMHHYLEIEIKDGKTVVNAVPSSRVLYEAYTLDCGGFANSQQLIEALRGLKRDARGQLLARVTLTGACAAELAPELEGVRDAVEGEFAFLDMADDTHPEESYEEVAAEDTSLGAFIEQINARIADAPDGAERRMLVRAREVGLAAYRNRELPIRGMERGPR